MLKLNIFTSQEAEGSVSVLKPNFSFWQQQHWKLVISTSGRLHTVLKACSVPCRDQVKKRVDCLLHIYIYKQTTVSFSLLCVKV